MRLMLRARMLAWCHAMRWLLVLSTKHRISRVYSHFGFRTYRIFCDCGREFK